MYLKNLTVLGFKSFADKTSLNFQPGVTAIVGPNGCGKSNVSDAIRWVLGEQSAKALRGGEMADVIFNGTDGRKPLGMAEVSLTIGGVDEDNLRAAGVELAYNEVTVTRRVFRDGGSEYFINKTPCRLKDVQQLFMGTGMGKTSYSIMAQGNITQILSSKPEDRRMIFEEAAGITKYKSQKKESLRKLEYTEQNLLRVADLIREVKRQIGSLQRQAGKARRYKQIMQELQHLDTQLARHQFDILLGEINERNSTVEKLRDEIENGASAVLRAENEISQLRERLSELEHQLSDTQHRGLELKNHIDRHESRIQFNNERLTELTAQNTQANTDITQADERKRMADTEAAAIRERLAAAEATLKNLQEALRAKQAALQTIEQQIIGDQRKLNTAQAEAFATLNGDDDAALLLRMRLAAQRALAVGITTIRDLGDRNYLALRLRDWFADGSEVGPRIVASGPPITTQNGHCWFLGGEIEGPDGMREAVRDRVARGVDVIKVMASGGNMTPTVAPHESQLGYEALLVAQQAAHAAGLPLAVHAHGAQAVADALAVGADSIEHCTFFSAEGVDADPRVLDRLAASDCVISMTAALLPGGAAVYPAMQQRLAAITANCETLHRAGARMVCSSDAGIGPNKPHTVLPHGVTSFLPSIGMTNAQAITNVTAFAAEVCRVADRTGTLMPGKDADILAVTGNPLENITAIHDVVAVYARGRRVTSA